MRSYHELVSTDPAWPEIAAAVKQAVRQVTVLPRDDAAARACLEALQVTTRSPLGAIAHETGGLLIDHGWLRILGSGHPALTRSLSSWNRELGIDFAQLMLVADDAVGGCFAINAGALGPSPGNVYYFAPDALRWEDIGGSYSAFMRWAFTGDLAAFYANLRWPGWEAEVEPLGGDRALSLYPPPWSAQGKDVAKVSRRPVPAAELWGYLQDIAAQLDGEPSR